MKTPLLFTFTWSDGRKLEERPLYTVRASCLEDAITKVAVAMDESSSNARRLLSGLSRSVEEVADHGRQEIPTLTSSDLEAIMQKRGV